MAFKGFNTDSLAQMIKEGTHNEEPIVHNQEPAAPTVEDTVLDIDIVDPPGSTKDNSKGDPDKGVQVQDLPDDHGSKKDGPVVVDNTDDKEINKTLADKGLNPVELNARLTKDGGFTDEFIAELKEKGLDSDLVDKYVLDFNAEMAKDVNVERKAEIEKANKEIAKMNNFIFDSVGGEDKFNAMAKVVKATSDPEALKLINAKLASKNQVLVKEGLKDAVNQYKKATGRSNNRMSGDADRSQAPEFTFMTKDAYFKAVGTEKYKTDPTYAQKVDNDRLKSKQMDAGRHLPGTYRGFQDGQMYDL